MARRNPLVAAPLHPTRPRYLGAPNSLHLRGEHLHVERGQPATGTVHEGRRSPKSCCTVDAHTLYRVALEKGVH